MSDENREDNLVIDEKTLKQYEANARDSLSGHRSYTENELARQVLCLVKTIRRAKTEGVIIKTDDKYIETESSWQHQAQ